MNICAMVTNLRAVVMIPLWLSAPCTLCSLLAYTRINLRTKLRQSDVLVHVRFVFSLHIALSLPVLLAFFIFLTLKLDQLIHWNWYAESHFASYLAT